MIRRCMSLLTLIAMLASVLAVGYAQTATATIVGTVLDPQGAVVSNATVVAKNVDTGIERTTRSTSEGFYRFDNLPPGVYDVSAEAQGFSRAEARSEEHTSELQSRQYLVCRLLLEKKKQQLQ